MNPTSPSSRRTFLTLASGLTLSSGVASPTRPIRIGQIGTTHSHAAGKLEAIRNFPEHYEVVGIVEPDAERRASLQDIAPYAGLSWKTEEELFQTPGLQAVAVETAIPDLVPTAVRCLQAGLHIHLDKPAGDSLEACLAMHALATEKNRTIQMGYMLRYNPAFQFAHRIVQQGWLGEITEISGMMGKFMGDDGRLDLAQYGGGGMFELACHLIDQVISFLGPPQKVTPIIRRTFPQKDTFADNQLAVFEYPKAIATIRCNHVDPVGGARRQFTITGTQGTFEIRPLEPKPRGRLGLDRPRGPYHKGFQDVTFDRPSGRYDAEFIDLAQVIRGEKSLSWDAAHDIATQDAILRASGMQ
ncbi:MAG: Gfo/Idh/MocA family oxidoreductase [Verrucomicrobiota bacterium]